MSAAFQLRDVENLLAMMERWAIAELHLNVGDAGIDLVRAAVPLADEAAASPLPYPHEVPSCMPIGENAEALTISASLVGVFHLATRGFSHGAPCVGDEVQAGKVIGMLESMHVLTELPSPVSGTIIAIFGEDGAGVEYGQPLMVIQPIEEDNEYEAIL